MSISRDANLPLNPSSLPILIAMNAVRNANMINGIFTPTCTLRTFWMRNKESETVKKYPAVFSRQNMSPWGYEEWWNLEVIKVLGIHCIYTYIASSKGWEANVPTIM